MGFEISPLPYSKDALAPHISAETVELHYEKHHGGYGEKLRKATLGKPAAERGLEELVRTTSGDLFNNAAQVWNHSFYWRSMKPGGGGEPDAAVEEAIRSSFRSVDDFRRQFAEAANGEFGSGWAWLVSDGSGRLRVRSSSDAENPLQQGQVPLLTLDVWEHAYYVDYRNERARYVEAFLDHLLDWDFVGANLALVAAADAGADVQGEGDKEADRRYREKAKAFADTNDSAQDAG